MGRPLCKDLVLRVLQDNPLEHFDSGDIARVLETKHGYTFHDGTIGKALRALWKERKCESLLNPHGGDTFALELRKPTPEEKAEIDARHAAWQVHIQAEWQSMWGKAAPENLSGPPGLWPEDVKKAGEAGNGRV
jgi:glutathione S-transferase